MATRFFFVIVLVLLLLGIHPNASFADTAEQVAAHKADLQNQLDALNAAITVQQQVLEQKENESNSLQRDIDIINAQIKKDQLSIKARDITIQTLTGDIADKNNTINSLNNKFSRELLSLAEILRKTNAIDATTFIEFLLSNQSVSNFFEDLNSFASIQGALQQSFADITTTKSQTTTAKTELEDQRSKEQELRQQQVIQEKQVEADKTQVSTLLNAVKAQESKFQSAILASKKVVAQINAELFTLRDTAAIPFSTALSYAMLASQKTGVRPAFILGILKQESDLGENVGACYLTDIGTGDGIGKNSATAYQKVMKAPRDTVPFQTITSSLGIPWATAPVSCPTKPTYSSSRGYGGAMGPAQFIPSTWQLYANRLVKALGVAIPNPWSPQDAIMATALYLSDIGASKGGYAAERNAACSYYSGRVCDNKRPANQFYGDQVMDNTAFFQNQIDLVSGS